MPNAIVDVKKDSRNPMLRALLPCLFAERERRRNKDSCNPKATTQKTEHTNSEAGQTSRPATRTQAAENTGITRRLHKPENRNSSEKHATSKTRKQNTDLPSKKQILMRFCWCRKAWGKKQCQFRVPGIILLLPCLCIFSFLVESKTHCAIRPWVFGAPRCFFSASISRAPHRWVDSRRLLATPSI